MIIKRGHWASTTGKAIRHKMLTISSAVGHCHRRKLKEQCGKSRDHEMNQFYRKKLLFLKLCLRDTIAWSSSFQYAELERAKKELTIHTLCLRK